MIALGQFLEVLIGGLMSGVLYSLVALGFVLIFKASGVFNYAQGAMVLLAGLALVRSLDLLVANGFPLWVAVGLAIFFQRTKTGRALRAVADDHLAAHSVGIPISWIWFVVWLAAGLVALVAATVWGTKLGVQFSITFLALKALPVLIIGGLTSVPGAIVGGLIVAAGENLAEVLLASYFGCGIVLWFALVLALAVLLVRPQGLFGERIIERI